jgi:hypothetical protein
MITAEGEVRSMRIPTQSDEEYLDEEQSVELEVEAELAFEETFPLRLVEGEDDRYADAVSDIGGYAAEELAMHVIEEQ